MLLRNTNISVINFTDTLLSTFLKSSINKGKTNNTTDLEAHSLTIDRCKSKIHYTLSLNYAISFLRVFMYRKETIQIPPKINI